MAWVTPRTWTTGELVTASHLNTHLRDNLLDIGFNGHIVIDRIQDLDPNTISTSEAVEETVTLAIPASWSTYDIEALVQTDVFESGTLTAIRVVTLRIRLTDVTGTIIGLTEVEVDTVDPNRWSGVVQGFIEGQTATGNVAVVFTTAIPGDTGQASTDNTTFIAKAYRTS